MRGFFNWKSFQNIEIHEHKIDEGSTARKTV
jgi:hypothetical protein